MCNLTENVHFQILRLTRVSAQNDNYKVFLQSERRFILKRLCRSSYRLCELFSPFLLLEADQHSIAVDQKRALDQHTVSAEQGELFFRAHGGELILQSHALVKLTRGVEKSLDIQSALFNPCLQLVKGRILLLDIAKGIFDSFFIQPFLRLLAGRTAGIANKQHKITYSELRDCARSHTGATHAQSL